MQTIAQQLKVKQFPFVINNANGKVIYYESSGGYWVKYEYDTNGNQIYHENSDGYWWKSEYDTNGKEIYCESSDGCWWKKEYDTNGKEIYWEDSDGIIYDDRPKTVELIIDKIAAKFGINVSNLKIKK